MTKQLISTLFFLWENHPLVILFGLMIVFIASVIFMRQIQLRHFKHDKELESIEAQIEELRYKLNILKQKHELILSFGSDYTGLSSERIKKNKQQVEQDQKTAHLLNRRFEELENQLGEEDTSLEHIKSSLENLSHSVINISSKGYSMEQEIHSLESLDQEIDQRLQYQSDYLMALMSQLKAKKLKPSKLFLSSWKHFRDALDHHQGKDPIYSFNLIQNYKEDLSLLKKQPEVAIQGFIETKAAETPPAPPPEKQLEKLLEKQSKPTKDIELSQPPEVPSLIDNKTTETTNESLPKPSQVKTEEELAHKFESIAAELPVTDQTRQITIYHHLEHPPIPLTPLEFELESLLKQTQLLKKKELTQIRKKSAWATQIYSPILLQESLELQELADDIFASIIEIYAKIALLLKRDEHSGIPVLMERIRGKMKDIQIAELKSAPLFEMQWAQYRQCQKDWNTFIRNTRPILKQTPSKKSLLSHKLRLETQNLHRLINQKKGFHPALFQQKRQELEALTHEYTPSTLHHQRP